VPWQECKTVLIQRQEFCVLADRDDANLAELCRRHRLSRKTAYKWLQRFRQDGVAGLADRSRRPMCSPGKIDPLVEQKIVALRKERPVWAGRKLRRRLLDLGEKIVPAASTIQRVVARNNLLNPNAPSSKSFIRFEHPCPNDLWQMDFKGHFALSRGRCHPLTILDDHSRFCLGLRGCDDQRGTTVQAVLEDVFDRYGLPLRILCDNGAPWGDDIQSPHTQLTIWLMRLGVSVCHGRPYHPQTQGKDERFHRTMKAELLGTRLFIDQTHFQSCADPWRDDYNLIRPHEALDLATPASRYQISTRPMPRSLAAIEYAPGEIIRKVDPDGRVSFKARTYKIGKAFIGQHLAIRPSCTDGHWRVCFAHHTIKTLDLRSQGIQP
jgi:transposase InsO family protein